MKFYERTLRLVGRRRRPHSQEAPYGVSFPATVMQLTLSHEVNLAAVSAPGRSSWVPAVGLPFSYQLPYSRPWMRRQWLCVRPHPRLGSDGL
jgi:hypothetical protein